MAMYPRLEYIKPRDDLAVILIRKAACSSMLTQYKYRFTKYDGTPAIAFVRDPIARVRSGWNFFKVNHWTFPYFPYPETYEDHVDAILGGQANIHWDPQVEILAGLDVKVYLFEDLNNVWQSLGFGKLRQVNKSPGNYIDDPDYRIDELRALYSQDIELRERTPVWSTV